MAQDVKIQELHGEAVVMGMDVIIKIPFKNITAAKKALKLLTKKA